MRELMSDSLASQRLYAIVLAAFAGVAALLSAVGIYGVLSYSVAERTREIGIRLALGAPRGALVALVVGQSALTTAVGILLGLAGAAGLTRFIRAMLFGLTPLDPGTFVVVALAFSVVAGVAAYVPVRRASRVDPLIALRAE